MHNQNFAQSGGTTPPYTDATRAPLLIGMTAGLLGLTLVFVVLRIYVRVVLLKEWGLDDALVCVSYILTMLTGMIFSICTTAGLGSHIWTIPVEVQQSGRRMTIAATLAYHLTFIVVKMAILTQYRRVFAVPRFCLSCDLMLGFIGIFGIAVVVSSVAISAPTWRGDTFQFERYNEEAWWLATATVHLATDLIIFFMPIPMLSRLKLERVQKFALIATFGVGFITTGISIVRISTITHVFTADVTWDVIPALVWSQAELCCAIVCACIPTLRPLLRTCRATRSQQHIYDRQTSAVSVEARLTRKPLSRGIDSRTLDSQQGIPSPMSAGLDVETNTMPETESKSLQNGRYYESELNIRTDVSPDTTAGEFDDRSDEFGPVDEEVATALTPPPKSYSSPTSLRPGPQALSDTTIEEQARVSRK
ncbi:hypothetical protein LZ30DRAFT_735673 [Colletotrichum cereale]|nr:hypothetical protein LZ30DRAFT_735673 [Colletotrichum cereale]